MRARAAAGSPGLCAPGTADCLAPDTAGLPQVWTPLQFARALVQSFPWTPDPLSIANCIAEAAREPSAESFLAAPRQPPASSSLFGGLTLSQVCDSGHHMLSTYFDRTANLLKWTGHGSCTCPQYGRAHR